MIKNITNSNKTTGLYTDFRASADENLSLLIGNTFPTGEIEHPLRDGPSH